MFVKVKCVLCWTMTTISLSVFLSDCCIYCTYCFLFWFSERELNLWNFQSARFLYFLTVLSLSLSVLSLYLLQLNLYITLTLYIAFIRRCRWSWAWRRRGIHETSSFHSITFYEFLWVLIFAHIALKFYWNKIIASLFLSWPQNFFSIIFFLP